MNAITRESLYTTLARLSGLLLIVMCVLFQRRGLMDWSEFVFLGACVLTQEAFVRVHILRRLRTPMMVAYSLMPLALVLYHSVEIRSHQGDFVHIVLFTPLPLVLVSVQIMVLYVREAARLVSVVLVLALFSIVIGMRRPLDDALWPWLALIGATATLFLMLQHPGMLFQGVYVARRQGTLPPTGRPGGIMRAAFFVVLPMFAVAVLSASLFLYISAPRLAPGAEKGQGYQVGDDPAGGGSRGDRGGPSHTGGGDGGDTTVPAPVPASVSGLSSGVDLGDFGEIKRSNTPALDIKVLKPDGLTLQRIYLRAFTYASFDGMRWSPLPADVGTNEIQPGGNRVLVGAPETTGLAYEEREFMVTLKEAGVGAMGQLPMPVEAQWIGVYQDALYYDPVSGTVRAPTIGADGAYTVMAGQLTLSGDELSERLADSSPAAAPRPEYLAVPPALKREVQRRFNVADEPEKRLYDRFAATVARRNRGTPKQRGVYAAAAGIVEMFRDAQAKGGGKAWTYSLDVRPKPGSDAIARFLDTSAAGAERFGHCEYFASAMCVLMRCYGVPARVCAGFVAMKPNDEGVFEVTASSAHAWVEVYFDEWGWIAFDPTPPEADQADGEEPEPETADPKTGPEVGSDGAETPEAAAGGGAGGQGKDWLQRYDRQAQEEMFSGVREAFDGIKQSLGSALSKLTSWMPDLLGQNPFVRILLLVVPVAAVVIALVWRRRRRKKMEAQVLEQMGEGGAKRQRSLYFQLLLLLARYGFQKRPSETPREFADRVLRKGGSQHMPIRNLTELYYSLRFGLASNLENDFKLALGKYSDGLRASVSEVPASSEPEPGAPSG